MTPLDIITTHSRYHRFIGEVHPDHDLTADLNLDQISIISIALELETAFQIEITDAEAHGWETAADVMQCVERKIF